MTSASRTGIGGASSVTRAPRRPAPRAGAGPAPAPPRDARRIATAPRSGTCAPARRTPPRRSSPSDAFSPVVERHPPLRIHPQDLARPQKRGREGVARRRERRQRGQQRIDLRQQPVAPAVERRLIERRIDVDALEAVLRQRLTEGRWNRDAALGVEPVGEMGEKAVHEAPRAHSPPASGERGSQAAARRRGPLTG